MSVIGFDNHSVGLDDNGIPLNFDGRSFTNNRCVDRSTERCWVGRPYAREDSLHVFLIDTGKDGTCLREDGAESWEADGVDMAAYCPHWAIWFVGVRILRELMDMGAGWL
jgi:hypothetical protein